MQEQQSDNLRHVESGYHGHHCMFKQRHEDSCRHTAHFPGELSKCQTLDMQLPNCDALNRAAYHGQWHRRRNPQQCISDIRGAETISSQARTNETNHDRCRYKYRQHRPNIQHRKFHIPLILNYKALQAEIRKYGGDGHDDEVDRHNT
ncbi:hypothetical protein GCM10011400_65700 [Paraburkholderia caffeinilytica]|uniref:Uncharacterized protein n=1 Tax=Paraburkholderia caffeinilytica TaxID=1761016 RepID=A0ABQ1NJI5_9BURK|nr:hypothetical protein GCM10011400_65700 [Paraburkholderia caffeinilytica]